MADRLTAHDLLFLYGSEPTTPNQVGNVWVLKPGRGGLGHADLLRVVADRLPQVPRYRQRIRPVPGGLARPVWVDDVDFELERHVRRLTLRRPGGDDELRALVAELVAAPLPTDRPLWELYLVDGLARGRVAVVSKTHEVMVDGSTPDLAEVLWDTGPAPAPPPAADWKPEPPPGDLELVGQAITELAQRPTDLLDSAQRGAAAALRALAAVPSVAGAVTGLLGAMHSAARPAPPSPLNVETGPDRGFAAVRTRLADYRRVRSAYGFTVNDVVLATVTGALRGWLLARGAPMNNGTVLRALVPLAVLDNDDGGNGRVGGVGGTRVSSYLVDLPVGEPNPVIRLLQLGYATRRYRQTGRFAGAPTLAQLSPPTLHALGARAGAGLSRRRYNLLITNVPGPRQPLYLAGARLLSTYPVVPLGKGQAVAIGLTSYRGAVYYGLNADRAAMPDLELLADLIGESLSELVEVTG